MFLSPVIFRWFLFGWIKYSLSFSRELLVHQWQRMDPDMQMAVPVAVGTCKDRCLLRLMVGCLFHVCFFMFVLYCDMLHLVVVFEEVLLIERCSLKEMHFFKDEKCYSASLTAVCKLKINSCKSEMTSMFTNKWKTKQTHGIFFEMTFVCAILWTSPFMKNFPLATKKVLSYFYILLEYVYWKIISAYKVLNNDCQICKPLCLTLSNQMHPHNGQKAKCMYEWAKYR